MSAYQKLKDLCDRHLIGADDIEDIINTYADCLEENEPYAVNAIQAARDVALGIGCELAELGE